MEKHHCRKECDLRNELVRYGRWLSRLGFTPGTAGNLSVRLDHERILVTPTGVSKALLRDSDIVIVDNSGRFLSGTKQATSEIGMHLSVYRQRPDMNAVIHSHPPISTGFACSGRGIDEILCQEAAMTVGVVPLASYATTGTEQVADSISPYLQKHNAILLENHGAVSFGPSLEAAFMRMETMEHLAHVAIVAHHLGSPRPLNGVQLEQLLRAKSVYHQYVSE